MGWAVAIEKLRTRLISYFTSKDMIKNAEHEINSIVEYFGLSYVIIRLITTVVLKLANHNYSFEEWNDCDMLKL